MRLQYTGISMGMCSSQIDISPNLDKSEITNYKHHLILKLDK
jgi:hypothetical protein